MKVKKDNFIRLTIFKTEEAISNCSIRLLKIHANIWILFSREQYPTDGSNPVIIMYKNTLTFIVTIKNN